jgi:molybdopterin-guanine dinucleotide biosynthesis protein B
VELHFSIRAAEFCAGYDLALAEGFKEAAVPRVEVLRSGVHEELLPGLPPPIAVVADFPVACGVPLFGPEDAAGLASYLEQCLGLPGSL